MPRLSRVLSSRRLPRPPLPPDNAFCHSPLLSPHRRRRGPPRAPHRRGMERGRRHLVPRIGRSVLSLASTSPALFRMLETQGRDEGGRQILSLDRPPTMLGCSRRGGNRPTYLHLRPTGYGSKMSIVYMPASHVLHSRLPWCRRLTMGTSRVVAMLRGEEKVRRREEAEVRCGSSSGSSSRPNIGRFWRAEETIAECVAGVHRARGLPPPARPPTPPRTLLQASLSPGSETLGKGGSGPVRLL